MPVANLFAGLPSTLSEELIETLVSRPGMRVERIVSHGHTSPEGFWYDQDSTELVILLQGAARLRFEDETLDLLPGAYLEIPAHRRHRVEWTDPNQPTVWLAIHYEG